MKKRKGGPIVDDPVMGYKWKDMGRKNKGETPGKGPIANNPIQNYKWPDSGRKNS